MFNLLICSNNDRKAYNYFMVDYLGVYSQQYKRIKWTKNTLKGSITSMSSLHMSNEAIAKDHGMDDLNF